MSSIGMTVISNFSINHNSLDDEGADEMTMEYRVVFTPFEEGSDEGEYTIREVYFDDDGNISWWSDEGVEFIHEDFWELADDFDAVAEAFDLPVLVLVNDELVEDDSDEDESDESEEETEE